ncbi:hypothetical protein DSO57_1024439 [Entomophthora muscae]|uniref:Uncharacterized protein n=1 Tax=Entomophthora muscae TaxID=34485 RepID=A0ACC2UNE5_9FUNG|nr:hypothetical protein DSO57_1024439 [Entomophthora muscae]
MWTEAVAKVNAALFPYSIQLKSGIDEESGTLMWALVNTMEDEISEQATDYIPSQLTYLDKLIEAIITAPNEQFYVTHTEALNLVMIASTQEPDEETSNAQLTANNLTKAERSAFIETYVEDGWLFRTRVGYLIMGVRAILELKFKLKAQYEGYISDCSLCEAPITQGVKCNGQECESRYHDFCLARVRSGATRCPGCSAEWTPIHIGPPKSKDDENNGMGSEGADLSDEDVLSRPRIVKRETSQEPSPESRSRRRRAQ